MTLDNGLKLTQIGFYTVGAVVALLTYAKAKRGLLNTVNTEYQKKVIDRLAAVADELVQEFDPESERYWAKQDSVDEIISEIHNEIRDHKAEIIALGEYRGGIPASAHEMHLSRLLERLKSDPFLPKEIRDVIVDLLVNRFDVMLSAFHEEIEAYTTALAKGKHWDTLDSNADWIQNRINKKLYQRGCGISQIHEEVHKIRLAIQKYLESFDPRK